MGIIQSGFNNALTGTAFLLNQAGAFEGAKARTETKNALDKTEKVRENYNYDVSVDQVKEIYKNIKNYDKMTDDDWKEITDRHNEQMDILNKKLLDEKRNIQANSRDPGYRAQSFEHEMRAGMRQIMLDKIHSKDIVPKEPEIKRGHDVLMDFIKGNDMAIEESKQRLAEKTRQKEEQKNRTSNMIEQLKHKNEFDKEADDFLNYAYGGKK